MTAFKNFLSFIFASVVTVFILAYLILMINGSGINIPTDRISESNFIKELEEYTNVCDSFSSLIFPDFFPKAEKSTADIIFSAVQNVFAGTYEVLKDIVYGNM